MPGELLNVSVPATSYLEVAAPASVRMRLIVRNNSVQYALGYGGREGGVTFDGLSSRWRSLPPGNYPLDESEHPFDAVRIQGLGGTAIVSLDCVPGAPNG